MSKDKKRKIKLDSDRYNESYESKDKGGVSKKSFLDFSGLKAKVSFFEPKEGINKLNIIPYEIKTKNHPRVRAGKAKVGDYDYNLDVYVHRSVGGSNETVLCPKKNYGKPCPICEEAGRFYDDDKKEEGKALIAQRRCVYNVEPIVKGESQGLKVWDISHFLFEKELIEEANACLDGKDIIPFADPEEGKVIKFRGSEEQFGKNKFLQFKGFSFLDRDEEIEEELLDSAVSLDSLLVVHSYEEIEKIFYGSGDDDDEKPSGKKSSRDDEEDDDEGKKSEKGKEKKSSKDDEEEEDDDDEKPSGKKSSRDDEEDDDEGKKSEKGKCPYGHKFGKDCDDKPQCHSCKLWDDCMEAGAK